MTPARRATAAGAHGFTLLEVMLSLVIFSMLTLMVYSAFFIGHRAVIKGERAADVNTRMRVADDVLGRQVRSAVNFIAHHEEERFPYFIGRADGMSFVSASPQAGGGTGLAVVTYRVAPNELVMEERVGFTPKDVYNPPSDAHVERAVLLAGFQTLRFEYLPAEEGEWQSTWDGRDEEMMPAAVRLTVEGLEFFGQPWVREIPLMTVVYGPSRDDFQDDDEEEGDDGGNGGSDNENDNENDNAGGAG